MQLRWFSRRAVLLHLTLLVVVAGCLYAAWWQANRALSGNTLSYIYSIEWPVFAGYGVFMWWKILHETGPVVHTAFGPSSSGEETSNPLSAVAGDIGEETSNPVSAVAGDIGEETSNPLSAVAGDIGEETSNPVSAVAGDEREKARTSMVPPSLGREDDPELDAYNRYLAGLAAGGKRKTWSSR